MCEREALANVILDAIERHAIDEDGQLNRDLAHIFIMPLLKDAIPVSDEDDDEIELPAL